MAGVSTIAEEKQTRSWWVPFGNTGLIVPRLSFGTGTYGWGGSSAQTRLGFRECVRLLLTAYEHGIAWVDSADQYGSHPHVREMLKSLDREKVVITTKLTARSKEQARQDIQRFLKELDTDYIDIVLMHCVVDANWATTMRPVMDAMSEAKERGYVKAVGVSCHSISALKTAATHPWVDVILARLNYDGMHMDGKPNEVLPVLETAIRNGKGVYAMKVFGQGGLRQDPEKALRFVFESGIQAATIGMVSETEVKQNVAIARKLFPEG